MSVNITSGGALTRMQLAINQGYKALNHNIEEDIKFDWEQLMKALRDCRKRAIEKNEKQEAIKNATTL